MCLWTTMPSSRDIYGHMVKLNITRWSIVKLMVGIWISNINCVPRIDQMLQPKLKDWGQKHQLTDWQADLEQYALIIWQWGIKMKRQKPSIHNPGKHNILCNIKDKVSKTWLNSFQMCTRRLVINTYICGDIVKWSFWCRFPDTVWLCRYWRNETSVPENATQHGQCLHVTSLLVVLHPIYGYR